MDFVLLLSLVLYKRNFIYEFKQCIYFSKCQFTIYLIDSFFLVLTKANLYVLIFCRVKKYNYFNIIFDQI